ncbi:MAG: ribosome biogenesis GTP-binding protein YihA/YsxC [Porticoccaceae bacterium]|jgi:GTP-binding protein|nr:ribosome biogenesis GTP-binding protein YihA/YsxC [Porticoccaceae bacterium]
MTEPVNFALAEFLKSAPTLQHCPADEGAEIAFAGRSNAGKSSAINCLTGQSKLARTSKTPGRTQLLNFFTLSASQRIVDLPGYGFAKVPIAMKKEWDRNLANYLQNRKSLKALVLLMDIRHPLQDYDWQMIQWAHQCSLPMHLLLTKADKLKNGPAKATQLNVAQQVRLKGITNISVQTFSSLKKAGLDELKQFLNQHLATAEQ